MERLLRVCEVAQLLACSSSEIYKLAVEGRLAHLRLGTALRFSEEQVQAFIEAATVPAAGGE